MRRRSIPPGTLLLPCALAVATLVVTGRAGADDLVTNGHFDQDTVGWGTNSVDVAVEWDVLDVDASPTSGSAEVTSTDSRLNTAVGITQCLTLPVEEDFDFAGSIYVPSAQAETATVGYTLDWYAGTTCSGGRIFLEGVGNTTLTDTWEDFADRFRPPEGSRSVVVLGRIAFASKNQPDGAFTAHFDAISFVPEPGATLCFATLFMALAGCVAATRPQRVARPAQARQAPVAKRSLWICSAGTPRASRSPCRASRKGRGPHR